MTALAMTGYGFLRRWMLDSIAEVGRVSLLIVATLRALPRGLRSFHLLVEQMYAIGVQSLMLVFIVSLFTGAVAAVQASYQFSSVVPLKYIGTVIMRSVIDPCRATKRARTVAAGASAIVRSSMRVPTCRASTV